MVKIELAPANHRVQLHQFSSSELLGLTQGLELDVFRRLGHVSEWSLDRVQIVSSNGYQTPFPSNVLVQLVLKVNEAGIAEAKEVEINQLTMTAMLTPTSPW